MRDPTSPDVPSVQLVPQDPPSQGCEGSQRKDLLPVPRHVSSVSRHPDDETSANAFKCGRRLVTRPAQGDAHLQFESAVNIEILEFTPTNLASHSGRAQSPLRQYYYINLKLLSSARSSSVLPRTATIHQDGDTIKRRKKVDLNTFKMVRNTPSGDFRSKSSWTIKSSLNQKEDIKDKRFLFLSFNIMNKRHGHIYDVIVGSVHAWEERILVTQFASATAAATVAASLAADANFLPMPEQAREGEGQGRKIRIKCIHTYIDSDRMSVTANDDENDDNKM
ncbi:hypothetical protein ALC56_05466 [Trachymyrmex septentrionalis]|uniref:Uncharacterized protein n=1 Tax=Trachymyrmex septentrionalis TaxID=34720 RepID=A0A195FJH9_9HYME|nr:hypothetical protein ALC56_05466 [Trachymyrmex septentrionalis]